MAKIISELETLLSNLRSDLFEGSLVDEYCNPRSPKLDDLKKEDLDPYTIYPAGDEDWLDIIADLERKEGEHLLPHREGPEKRCATTLEYLSHPNSFVFFNVGSFHKNVFHDEAILELLEKRLKENEFRYIVTSSNRIMKNKDGKHPFLERLFSHQDKGIVIDMGKRPPLHFISVIYNNGADCIRNTCFEYDHDEKQDFRDRYFVNSTSGSDYLYLAHLQSILKNGEKRTSITKYKSYTTQDDNTSLNIDV